MTVGLPGPFDLAALVVGSSGTVSGDADMVFRNAPARRSVARPRRRQGYADGLAGLARDFGVDLAGDAAPDVRDGYRKVAENIAAGQRTAAEVVRGWMESPGHRANILDGELTQIGVGHAAGGSCGVYWTQVFGTLR